MEQSNTVAEFLDLEPVTDFKRDHWGRPLIAQTDGSKPVGYVRSSSAAKVVDDTYNLDMWARRNVVYGMAHSPDLVAQLLALGGAPQTWDKGEKIVVNELAVEAQRVAKSHAAAEIGTAVHRMTERLDLGETFEAGPYSYDMEAYAGALRRAGVIIYPEWVECRMVCDPLKMAGTADRIVGFTPQSDILQALSIPDGQVMIADLKTGTSVDFGALGFAAQLAAYAHGTLYDIENDVRVDTPDICKTHGLIIHLPAGQGTCTLYLVDLVAGYAAAELANQIRDVRKEAKGWLRRAPQPCQRCDDTWAPTTAAYWGQRLCADCSKECAEWYDDKGIWPAKPGDDHIEQASRGLETRLNAAKDHAGLPPGWRWPLDVPRFKDGGPATWAQVKAVEAATILFEAFAQMEFEAALPDDPFAGPPVPFGMTHKQRMNR